MRRIHIQLRRSTRLALGAVAALAIVLTALGPVQAMPLLTTVTLQPDATAGKDTIIQNVSGTTNYGALNEIYVGEQNNGSGYIDHSLIQFDLSSIPSNATINSATLSLYLTLDMADNGRTFRVYRSKRAWDEGTKTGSGTADGATWNVYSTGNSWQTAGGFGANDTEQTDIGSHAFGASDATGAFYDFTLTASKIQEMLTGGSWTNNGFFLKADTELNDAYGFASSDDSTAGHRPKLVIDYTVPTATPTNTSTPTQANTATPNPTGLTSGLLSYWNFDDSLSTGAAASYGGQTLNGALCGIVTAQNAGRVGTSFFMGSSSCVSGTDADPVRINPSGDWTWAGWVYPQDTTAGHQIIGKSITLTNTEFFVQYNAAGVAYFCWGTAGTNCVASTTTTSSTLTQNAWNFIAFGKASDSAWIELNNKGRAVLSGTSGWQTVSAALRFGTTVAFGLAGGYDEWGLWRSATGGGGALTDAQLTALYNSGSGCTFPFNNCAASPTATPVPGFGGNLIRNWDFNVPPLGAGAEWSTLDRVIAAPAAYDGTRVSQLPKGSCGQNYWVVTTPLIGGVNMGTFWQRFVWPGGPMYINFEAQTSDLFTVGGAKVVNESTGSEYGLGTIYNPWGTWLTFKIKTPTMAAGNYKIQFNGQLASGANQGMAVDDVNVRTGYWGNDCTDPNYEGSINPSQVYATPTPFVTWTPQPPAGNGVNIITNCDFEQGLTGWNPNSVAVSAQPVNGATGPTWAQLQSIPIPGIFPGIFTFVTGDINQPFTWGGGTIYSTFWLKDGTAANLYIANTQTGYRSTVDFAAPPATQFGWTREQFQFVANTPGQYVIGARIDVGGNAGVDGITASANDYAGGTCATLSGYNANATQAAGEATATAQATGTSGAGTATAIVQQTLDAIAQQTYDAGSRLTSTANANQTGTATAAHATQTQAAQQTATAQGTAVPTVTPAPTATAPRFTATPTFAPPATVPAATASQAVSDLAASQTALAVQALTQAAGIVASQTALAAQQTAAAQTQTQEYYLVQTQNAVINLTALARQSQTAVAATSTAQAQIDTTSTAIARQTGTAVAGATQTALVATANATSIAQATTNAAATQTAQAQVNSTATAQAQASATAGAQATTSALGTQEVQPRPEPAPYVDCVRPTNPLALADWIDYEVCRVLTWWVWTPTNSQQVLALQNGVSLYEPIGTLVELDNARAVAQKKLDEYDWADTGLQVYANIPWPLADVFFPRSVPRGLLTGELDLTPKPAFGSVYFSTVCTVKVGNIFGQAMAAGLCAFINWLIYTGIMGWVQYLFDLAVWVAFIRYAWNLVTVKLPQIL